MREILFRGQHVDSKVWCYGYLVKQFGATEIYLSGNTKHYWDKHHVIPETVGQFTGLTDSHGKKVFEGDIVRIGRYFSNFYTADDYVCRYDTTTASFKFYYIIPKDIADVNKYAVLGDGETLCGMGRGYVVENVVGNIYDNINYAE